MNRIMQRIAEAAGGNFAILKNNILNITTLINRDLNNFTDEDDKEKLTRLIDSTIKSLDELKQKVANFKTRIQ